MIGLGISYLMFGVAFTYHIHTHPYYHIQLYREPGAHEQSVQERMDQLGFKPDYFVITCFDLFQRKHQDLGTYLESACSARLETTDYLIYSHYQTLLKQ